MVLKASCIKQCEKICKEKKSIEITSTQILFTKIQNTDQPLFSEHQLLIHRSEDKQYPCEVVMGTGCENKPSSEFLV